MTIDSVSNLYFTSEENRGIIMIKNLILRLFVSIPLLFTAVNAQDGVDAIEKARQAKEAADKAAAEAAAATEAAIEQAAQKAAKEARLLISRGNIQDILNISYQSANLYYGSP